jgi:UDP-N-acetylglucosamine acyltransferase
VTISLCAAICGHVKILKGANIGANAVIHQRSVIGHYAIVGMGSVVAKDVPPLAFVKGNPARYARQNTHVLKSVQIDL